MVETIDSRAIFSALGCGLLLFGSLGCHRDPPTAAVPVVPPECLTALGYPPPFPAGSFGHARGADNPVEAIAVLPGSGGLYIGGSFTHFDSYAAASAARVSVHGAFDPAFATGSGFDGPVFAALVAPDASGDVYLAGWITAYQGVASRGLIRLDCHGARDPHFATTLSAYALAASRDGSGDIFAGGANGVSRVRPDGTIAWNFRSGFVVSLASAMDGSGDVFAAGDNGPVVRLHADGTRDAGFTVGWFADSDSSLVFLYDVVAAADGSGDLYVAGSFNSYEGAATGQIVRLNADGSLDSAFDTTGGFDKQVLSLAAADDGSGDVYAGGAFTTYQGVAAGGIIRLHRSGARAETFDSGTGFDYLVYELQPLGDGTGADRLARLNGDGAIQDALLSRFDEVRALLPDASGSGKVYVLGGLTYAGVPTRWGPARLNPDGTLDNSFAIGEPVCSELLATLDGSGDIYVAGRFSSYAGVAANAMVRLHPDGSVNPAFSVPIGTFGEVYAVANAIDGSRSVYAAGRLGLAEMEGGVIRLLEDGSVDHSFSSTLRFGSGQGISVMAPAADASGDVYVGGGFNVASGAPADGIVRLKCDGTLDGGFAPDPGLSFDAVYAILPVADGSGDIYVGGVFSHTNGGYNDLVRLHADGSIAGSFAVGVGFGGSKFQGFAIRAVAPAGEAGDIYVGGTFASYNGVPGLCGILRLRPDGSIATSFAAGCKLSSTPELSGSAWAIANAADGTDDIYVGGYFFSYDTWVVESIVRIKPDGSAR